MKKSFDNGQNWIDITPPDALVHEKRYDKLLCEVDGKRGGDYNFLQSVQKSKEWNLVIYKRYNWINTSSILDALKSTFKSLSSEDGDSWFYSTKMYVNLNVSYAIAPAYIYNRNISTCLEEFGLYLVKNSIPMNRSTHSYIYLVDHTFPFNSTNGKVNGVASSDYRIGGYRIGVTINMPGTMAHEVGHEHQRPKSRKKGGITFNDRAYDLVNDSLGIIKAKALKRNMYDTVTVKFKNTFLLYNDLDFDTYSIMGYGSMLNNPKGDIYKLLDNNDTDVYQRANCDEIISPIDISVGDVVKIRKLYPKMFRFFNNTNSNLYAKVFLGFSDNPYLLTIIPGDSLSLRVGEDGKNFILINDYTDVYVTKILFAGAELNEGIYFEENRITYQSSECTSVLAKQFTETNPIDIYLGTAVSKNGLDGKGGMSISMFWSNSIGASMLTDLTPTSLVCEVTEL